LKTGRLNEARKLLEKAIEVCPKCDYYHYNLAKILYEQKNYELAIISYNKAIELNPHNFEFHFNKALNLLELEKYSEGVSCLNLVIQKFPNEGSFYFNRGRALYQLDKYFEAIEDFKESINNKYKIDESYNNIGDCYFFLKEYQDALENYKIAVTLNETQISYIYNVVYTYFEMNKLSEAELFCLKQLHSVVESQELELYIKTLMSKVKNKKKTKKKYKNLINSNEDEDLFDLKEVQNVNQECENINETINYEHQSTVSESSRGNNIIDSFYLNCFTKEIPITNLSKINIKELDEFFYLAHDLKQENIISYYGYQLFNKTFKVKMEMCQYDSLNNILNREGEMSMKDKIKISSDCAGGLFFLHDKNLIHGNLKLNNVMIFKTNQNVEITAKLSDYGIIHLLEKLGVIDFDLNNFKNFRWRAPEFMTCENIDIKSDIYSFGILLWEIFSCKIPYAEYSRFQLIHKITNENLRPCLNLLDPETPDVIKKLILKCWDHDKQLRPTSEELVFELKSLVESFNC
jgi:tetratricopeptide (TPR) repeat protein